VTYQRAKRPKASKLVAEQRLGTVVAEKLALRWSPQQISGWLEIAYPDDSTMRVSHETIYLSLFIESRGALSKDLRRSLRTGRAMRFPRRRRLPQRRGQLRDMVPISRRPVEVQSRLEPGHWEGDVLEGRRPSAVATLVERTTRYVVLFALPAGRRAENFEPALRAAFSRLPHHMRRSLTWDRGREMAEHARFSTASGVPVYFCDPRSPWQRGTCENLNGLLRQYLGKSADLRRFTQAELDSIADQLNARPRRTLGFLTPLEVLEVIARGEPTSSPGAITVPRGGDQTKRCRTKVTTDEQPRSECREAP
jgi:IS30 family transposase